MSTRLSKKSYSNILDFLSYGEKSSGDYDDNIYSAECTPHEEGGGQFVLIQ